MNRFIEVFKKNEILSEKFLDQLIIDGNKKLSFKRLYELIYYTMDVFIQKNIKKNNIICILTYDYFDAFPLYIASLRLGITPCFFHINTSFKEILEILKHLDSKTLFIKKDIYKRIKQDIPNSFFKDIDVFIMGQRSLKDLLSFKKKYLKLSWNSISSLKEEKLYKLKEYLNDLYIDKEDDAILLLTSGTTGRSKVIPLTYDNLFTQIEVLKKYLPFCDNVRILNFFGVSPIDGVITNLLLSFWNFSTTIYQNKLGESFLEIIFKYKANILLTTPSMVVYYLRYLKETNKTYLEKIKNLQFCIVTGSYLHPKIWREFEEVFNKPIYNTYGMTEIGTLVSVATPNEAKMENFDTLGKWAIGDYLILDEERCEVSIEEVGELFVTGPTVVKRYIGNDKFKIIKKYNKTWFSTGDLVCISKNGLLTYKDRKKNIIISGGVNIVPHEINSIFFKHPSVSEVATVGLEDEMLGERVASAIVLKENQDTSREDFFKYIRKNIDNYYKAPRVIEILSSLPRGPSGKVITRQLKEFLNKMVLKRKEYEEYIKGKDKVTEKIIEIGSECLGISKEKCSLVVNYEDNRTWDSIAHMDMVIKIEEIFKIKLKIDDIVKVKSLKDFKKIVLRNLN